MHLQADKPHLIQACHLLKQLTGPRGIRPNTLTLSNQTLRNPLVSHMMTSASLHIYLAFGLEIRQFLVDHH